MPAEGVLEDYYRNYFPNDRPRITMPRVQTFVRSLFRSVRVTAAEQVVRVLDFGGGDGTLGLAVARHLMDSDPDRQVHFTLVDYQTPASPGTDKRLTLRHARHLAEVTGPFDLVLASAVLEHIPALQPVLEQLFGLMAPGAWFYARTPYAVPLKRLWPKLDITYPGHVHDLGAPFWNRVPATFGQPLRLVVSRPSIVETEWLRQPGRTTAAWLMKLPARLELVLWPGRLPAWRLVGGWEVIFERSLQSEIGYIGAGMSAHMRRQTS
jgi:SAM-dependent methyltransferase